LEEKKTLDRSLRDMLAMDRTRLANQRTILAYSVTAMHIMALGITFQTVKDLMHMAWMAWPLYCLAIAIAIIGFFSYRRVSRDMDVAYRDMK